MSKLDFYRENLKFQRTIVLLFLELRRFVYTCSTSYKIPSKLVLSSYMRFLSSFYRQEALHSQQLMNRSICILMSFFFLKKAARIQVH